MNEKHLPPGLQHCSCGHPFMDHKSGCSWTTCDCEQFQSSIPDAYTFQIIGKGEGVRLLENAPLSNYACIAPVVWRNKAGKLAPLGTAWCLMSKRRIFVTAKHLFEDVLPWRQLPEGLSTIENPQTMVMFPDGSYLQRAGVFTLSTSILGSGDLAMLEVDDAGLTAQMRGLLKDTIISTNPPKPGDFCMCLGYPSMEIDDGQTSGRMPLVASEGTIIDVFPRRRDSALGPFPSFHFSAHTPNGMSGGPIFDSHGGVIGIVSSGTDPSAENEAYCFAASIAPLIHMAMPDEASGGAILGRSPVVDEIRVIGPPVTVNQHPEGGYEVAWAQ